MVVATSVVTDVVHYSMAGILVVVLIMTYAGSKIIFSIETGPFDSAFFVNRLYKKTSYPSDTVCCGYMGLTFVGSLVYTVAWGRLCDELWKLASTALLCRAIFPNTCILLGENFPQLSDLVERRLLFSGKKLIWEGRLLRFFEFLFVIPRSVFRENVKILLYSSFSNTSFRHQNW